MNSIPNFTKKQQIRNWFPITMLKNGTKLHPYSLNIAFNGIYMSLNEFEEKTGKKIKLYFKELAKDDF